MTTFLFSIALLILLIFIGVPVAYSMGLSSILYIILVDPSYLQILPVRTMYRSKLLYPDVYPVLYAGG